MMIVMGAAISPKNAASAPGIPRNRAPSATERLMTFGPGRNWHNAKISVNSAGPSQRRRSTTIRRAQGSTPPIP